MIANPTLSDRFLSSAAAEALLRRLSIDVRQYRLLLDLFRSLSDRQEFMGTMDVRSLSIGAGFSVFLSLLLSCVVLLRPSLHGYLFTNLGITMLMLGFILLGEVANCLLNPDESLVLTPMPIGGATFVGAKLSHVLVVVVVLVSSLNVLPAIAGLALKQVRWFYPLMHLLAAYLTGLFVAFFTCGLYGWLFRLIRAEKLRSVSLGIQVVLMGCMPLMGSIPQLVKGLSLIRIHPSQWAWFPLNWFVAIGLVGQSIQSGFRLWRAGLSVTVTLLMLVWGFRSFSADYLVKVSTLIQGRSTPVSSSSRPGGPKRLIRGLTGDPVGVGSFAFTNIMIRRDWHFRRQVFPMLLGCVLGTVSIFVGSKRVSPFSPSGFSPAHILPHLLGLMLIPICAFLSFSDSPKGSWMFVTAPFDRARSFFRGIYWAIWLPFVGTGHLAILAAGTWFWGWKDALLFSLFSASLVSFYLSLTLLLISGLPFANPFKPSRAAMGMPIMVIGLMLAGVFGVIQWLIFHRPAAVVAAILILGLLAFASTRWTMKNVEGEIRLNLHELEAGPAQMFNEVE